MWSIYKEVMDIMSEAKAKANEKANTNDVGLFEASKRICLKNYRELVIQLDNLRTAYEDELTAFVKNAQSSKQDGIDIEDLDIFVDLDGDEMVLVEAIRVCDNEGWDNMLEILVPDEDGESVWMSIYDFYPDTAIKILTGIMESDYE